MSINRIELADKFALAMERARLQMGLTQAQMAEKMNMSTSNYKKIISGETIKIDLSYMIRLHELAGVRVIELIDDNGSEAELLRIYRRLSDQQKRFLTAVARFEQEYITTRHDSDKYLTVLVPTGCMQDGMIYDSCDVQKIEASEYFERFGNRLHMGIKVTSNHLTPVYNRDDIILLCCEPIRDGDTGVFLHKPDGCIYLRKYHQSDIVSLEPVNGFGRTFTVDQNDAHDIEQWAKVGYVLAKMRS